MTSWKFVTIGISQPLISETWMLSLVTIEIEPSFRSLFYHDSLIIKTFCSREQSTSHVHAYTFIELKNSHKELFLTLNCFSRDWNLILAWEGQTDPWKTSADCRMIAIVDDEELEKEEGISNYTPKYTNKHIVGSRCLLWMGGGTQQ